MRGGNTGNGFDKDPERARLAGQKSKPSKQLKAVLSEILQEKVPDKDIEKLKKRYGIDSIENNGEAIIREVVRKAKMIGDIKTLETILKISGEYSEKHTLLGEINIIEVDKQDKGLV